jgi:hypothetical protein
LLRRDFSDQGAQDDQLRWWHTRALHNAWGISDGLRVTAVKPGETVELSAGVAFDLFGRELVLSENRQVPVPETADEYILLIRYDHPVPDCESTDGLCVESFVAASGVRLIWKLRRTVTPADGVPLAILNEDDTCPPPFARPHVRPLARPKVGYGAVTVSSREFTPWRVRPGKEPVQIGWEYGLDTRAAGFTKTPFYFAEIAIPVHNAPPALILAAGRYHLAQADPDHVAIRYLSPPRLRDRAERQLFGALGSQTDRRFSVYGGATAREKGGDIDVPIQITWIGIELRRTVAPAGSEVHR